MIDAETRRPFMIHHVGAVYAPQLVDEGGLYCYDLDEAKEVAAKMFPGDEYELYNGDVAWTTDEA